MAFVYETRGLDGLGQRIHFRNDLDQDCALNHETGDYLVFSGRDVQDPTQASTYVLRNTVAGFVWRIEVLDYWHGYDAYLASLPDYVAGKHNCLAVMHTHLERFAHTTAPYEVATQALQVFLQRPDLKIKFLDNWDDFRRWQNSAAQRRS